MMHVGSAMTHVYPDDVYLEKLDHLGIATLVMGTPISTIMVRSLATATVEDARQCNYRPPVSEQHGHILTAQEWCSQSAG